LVKGWGALVCKELLEERIGEDGQLGKGKVLVEA
jgi:hypothetical protein